MDIGDVEREDDEEVRDEKGICDRRDGEWRTGVRE